MYINEDASTPHGSALKFERIVRKNSLVFQNEKAVLQSSTQKCCSYYIFVTFFFFFCSNKTCISLIFSLWDHITCAFKGSHSCVQQQGGHKLACDACGYLMQCINISLEKACLEQQPSGQFQKPYLQGTCACRYIQCAVLCNVVRLKSGSMLFLKE